MRKKFDLNNDGDMTRSEIETKLKNTLVEMRKFRKNPNRPPPRRTARPDRPARNDRKNQNRPPPRRTARPDRPTRNDRPSSPSRTELEKRPRNPSKETQNRP